MTKPRRGETSAQDIFRVIVDAMLDQESNEFFLKSSLAWVEARKKDRSLGARSKDRGMCQTLGFLLLTARCTRVGTARPRILIQSESEKDRRQDECGREEVRRRYSDAIKGPAEEERRDDA